MTKKLYHTTQYECIVQWYTVQYVPVYSKNDWAFCLEYRYRVPAGFFPNKVKERLEQRISLFLRNKKWPSRDIDAKRLTNEQNHVDRSLVK
jgi:hypothetical protein